MTDHIFGRRNAVAIYLVLDTSPCLAYHVVSRAIVPKCVVSIAELKPLAMAKVHCCAYSQCGRQENC